MSDLEAYEMPAGYGDTAGRCLTFAEIDAMLAAERERCAVFAEARSKEWAGAARGAASRIAR